MKKNSFKRPGLCLVVCLFFIRIAYGQADSLSYAKECHVRKGLPNFFSRLLKHQPVTIAYLGGSITAASNGWREQSAAWLQKEYPQAVISSINSTIGGTGSDLGVFRLRKEILDKNPDLVFIEFAVNDYGKDTVRIHEAMEGIVRQIWRHNRKIDICFVYTLSEPMVQNLLEHKLPASAFAMEQIAKHYQIPTVHFGLEVVELVTSGKLIFKGKRDEYPSKIVFSPDNVHPYAETGHRLYTEALARSLQLMDKSIPAKRYPHHLVKAFNKNNWEGARMISVIKFPRTGSWKQLDTSSNEMAKMMQIPLLKSGQPGSSVIIKFKGTLIGLYDVVGPGNGQYEVYIDGKRFRLYPRFDRFSYYNRRQYFILPRLANRIHTIEFKVSDEKVDKKTVLNDNYTKIENKEVLEENFCYAGAVFIIGRLIK